MLARLSRLVLTVRGAEGLAKSVEFYHKIVGLPVTRVTDAWAELDASGGGSSKEAATTLHLQVVETESQLSTGYSPMITFEVEDMDKIIVDSMQAGAHLDGPIQYPAHGKVASLRTPDGHMIGVYEPIKK